MQAAGNAAFQSGKHAEAVEHYTAAVSCNFESRPFTAICFCNRAAAYRAMGQISDAIADCSLAIALDGNYAKVWFSKTLFLVQLLNAISLYTAISVNLALKGKPFNYPSFVF